MPSNKDLLAELYKAKGEPDKEEKEGKDEQEEQEEQVDFKIPNFGGFSLTDELDPDVSEAIEKPLTDVVSYSVEVNKSVVDELNKVKKSISPLLNELKSLREFKNEFETSKKQSQIYQQVANDFKKKYGVDFTKYQESEEWKDYSSKCIDEDSTITFEDVVRDAIVKGKPDIAFKALNRMIKNGNSSSDTNVEYGSNQSTSTQVLRKKKDANVSYYEALQELNQGNITHDEFHKTVANL